MLPALFTLAILGLALLLGATAYESIIIAPNFARDIPGSIGLARQFLQRTPAYYFRPLTPLTQVLLLACLVASWSTPSVRWSSLLALACMVIADIITFTYHYPRLAIMFRGAGPQDPASLSRAARDWARGNWVRAGLILVALLATIHAIGQVWAAIGRLTIS